MKAPQRREREIARTREDIVEAASRAFVAIGVHDATMQDIAHEAGYTAASLYTYFRSKQEIVEAVMDLLTAEFVRVFDQPLPGNLTFPQRFEIVLLQHLELIEKRRALMLSFHTAEAESSHCPAGSHGEPFHQNFERRILFLADWLKKNAKPEEIGGHDPELVARLLVGMVFGLLHGWVAKAEGSLADRAPLLRDFFFHGVSGKSKAGGKKKMSATRITLVALTVSLLAAGTAAAEPMTLAKCIDVALHGNPDITSANLEVEATTAQRKSARGAFGPRLHLDAGIQRWDSPLSANFADMLIPVVNAGLGKNGLNNQLTKSDFTGQLAPLAQPIELRAQTTWSASVTLAQPITSLWTINEGYALRKMGVDLAGLQRKVARRDVAFQVTEAYYRVLQAVRLADVAQKSVENIDAQVKRAQSFFRAGTVGRNDVLRAELGLAAAKQRLIQANGGVVLARGQLARLMGLPPESPIDPVDSITDVTVTPMLPAVQAEDRAVAERLEMKEIAAQTELARASESLAKSKMLPQVNAVANYTHASPATMFAPKQDIWFIGGTASWDIWEGGGTYYGIDEAKARLAQALSARRKAEDGIRLETRSAHVNATTAAQALTVARDAVEQAEENFRIEQKRYESGDNTSFDVLDAENQLTTARGQLQAATYDSLIAQSSLARATGQQSPIQGNTL